MPGKIRLLIVGFGKIARDQHVFAISKHPDIDLVGIVSEHGEGLPGMPLFRTLDEALASDIEFDATSHCNIPLMRFETVTRSLEAGKHCLMEKPPTATLGEMQVLEDLARETGLTVMTSWHSQNNAAVDAAKEWLADKDIETFRINWCEDVRKWHPGQEWIWEPSGFGIFDPGINGISIATKILPFPLILRQAELEVPEGRQTPIAADINFASGNGDISGTGHFDWRTVNGEEWTISVTCKQGELLLENGGRKLSVDGDVKTEHGDEEYPAIYRHFAHLLEAGESFIHTDPLRLVCDANMVGYRQTVDPFTA